MHLITYVSEYSESSDCLLSTLQDISEKSAFHNKMFCITGILLFCNNCFMQILEGNRNNLLGLMKIIEKDTRHTNVEILVDTQISERTLHEWRMDCIQIEDPECFNRFNLKVISRVYTNNFKPKGEGLLLFCKEMLTLGQCFTKDVSDTNVVSFTKPSDFA